MAEKQCLVVKSAVKEFIANYKAPGGGDMRMSGDFCDAFSEVVAKMLDAAIQRCVGNDRVTVKPVDA